MSEDRQSGQSRRALRTERQSQAADTGQQGEDPAAASHPDAGQGAAAGDQPQGRRRAADSPVDAKPVRSGERESLARARDREALRAYKALADQESPKPQQPLTRRQLRQQQLEAERRAGSGAQAGQAAAGSAGDDGNPLNNLSVEEALAARSALVEQAKNQMAMLEASGRQDPRSVDLDVLAEQKKLAERAAVLNRRALDKQRLSAENQQRKPQPNDPAAAHNLAMVTPLEFVKIPGRELPVMKPPTTAHIPIITPPVDRQRPEADSAQAVPGRSRVLARAEAVASTPRPSPAKWQWSDAAAAPERGEEGEPISAHTAHGLEPLDARTSGLARGNRVKLIQVLVVAAGAVAIMVGLIMILGG